ncbi:hypothetical protein [Microbacterium arborescens]|uniref:hypothetical protein n=1 Tax=Microbacterium arborescens TaxID=33883 RepID=UPI000DF7D0E2|nr:hypothetical protein [Microbacterium arborescens]
MRKQTAVLAKWAKAHGCTYDGVTPSGHVRIILPDGAMMVTRATPNDRASLHQAQRDIARRLGIPVPAKPAARYKKGTGHRGFSMRAALDNQRPDRSGVFTVGDVKPARAAGEPAGLVALRAQEQSLAASYAAAPTGALEVQLRNVRARIRARIY